MCRDAQFITQRRNAEMVNEKLCDIEKEEDTIRSLVIT